MGKWYFPATNKPSNNDFYPNNRRVIIFLIWFLLLVICLFILFFLSFIFDFGFYIDGFAGIDHNTALPCTMSLGTIQAIRWLFKPFELLPLLSLYCFLSTNKKWKNPFVLWYLKFQIQLQIIFESINKFF